MELTDKDFDMVNKVRMDILETSSWYDGKPHLTLEQEEILEWALEFMKRYEKRHGKYKDRADEEGRTDTSEVNQNGDQRS